MYIEPIIDLWTMKPFAHAVVAKTRELYRAKSPHDLYRCVCAAYSRNFDPVLVLRIETLSDDGLWREFQDRVQATVYGTVDGDDVEIRNHLLMTTKPVGGKQWVKGIDDDNKLQRAMELGARYGSGSFLGQPDRLELAKKIRVAWVGS